jgi:hypothetical protein
MFTRPVQPGLKIVDCPEPWNSFKSSRGPGGAGLPDIGDFVVRRLLQEAIRCQDVFSLMTNRLVLIRGWVHIAD